MKSKGCFMCSPTALKFKLALMGIMFALALMVLGAIPPLNQLLVPFPMPWILGLTALIPSLVLYYSVKENFWAEYGQWMKKNKMG